MKILLTIQTGKTKYSENALKNIDNELKKTIKSLRKRNWKLKSKLYWETKAEAMLEKGGKK